MAARANASIGVKRKVAGHAMWRKRERGLKIGRERKLGNSAHQRWEQVKGAREKEGEEYKGMDATHPLTSAASPLRLSSIGAGEVEVAMLSDCDCDFSVRAVAESGCDVITAIKVRRQDEKVGTVANYKRV